MCLEMFLLNIRIIIMFLKILIKKKIASNVVFDKNQESPYFSKKQINHMGKCGT